jgi:crotonobetainyl-CoA:carnitine CoA-transferase CaiB-like acyl-CoA transferase
VNIGVANDQFWALFCEAAECRELRDAPRFATASARVENRAALLERLVPLIRARGRDEWVALLSAVGVPCGAIRGVSEVCTAPQLTTRGMVLEAAHPAAGVTRSIASPARFGAAPPPIPRPAPMLGQHQAEVLHDWLGETT